VAEVSPCQSLDLPQTYLEPLLLRYATSHGVTALFNTSFQDLEQDSKGCSTTVISKVTNQKTTIRSRFVFGCDGAKSPVAAKIGLKYDVQPSGGVAYNILFNADLTSIMGSQAGHLHWIMQPDSDLDNGVAPVLRMVRPWNQWILVVFPKPGMDIKGFGSSPTSRNQIEDLLRAVVGRDDIPIAVLDISAWRINETAAKSYVNQNV
jgi:2-polyprenyl-6-methoxyphenol hydroxylase-like FAD-dependent oxidoreductase